MSEGHRIFLHGTNGYVASHTLSRLLASSTTSVRAVVRSASRSQRHESLIPEYIRKQVVDYAVVPGITVPDALGEA
jgi:uncharacterized protein YbjT (DUF2867 family)